jgi:hypothetical protein
MYMIILLATATPGYAMTDFGLIECVGAGVIGPRLGALASPE